MGNGAFALGDSLAPLPWHLRENLGPENTSVFKHPRQTEELRVLERCCKERIIIGTPWRGDT